MAKLEKIRLILLWILITTLLGIGIFTFNYFRTAGQFNLKERSLEGIGDNKEASVAFAPRGGSTDSWTKYIQDEEFHGVIYELTVGNLTGYPAPTWSLRINFHQLTYLNNAWCGQLEVHQFRDGAEITQTVDLRNYSLDNLTCDYILADQDLMIVLHDGDYLVYQPSVNDWEVPLNGGSTVSPGIIFYHKDETIDFSDVELSYKLHRETLEGNAKLYFIVAAALWLIVLAVFVTMCILLKIARDKLSLEQKTVNEFLSVFSNFVDAKDTYTQGHSHRVAEYSRIIAEKMGKDSDECHNVYIIGLMHDCGKVYIPDDILKKPGRLTDEEFAIIKSHTMKGGEMLKDVSAIPQLMEGALHHHERYDGRGYPDGLKGKNIPEVGRIICVADSFDAMNSRRCYRANLSEEVIREELTKNKGTQFDPEIVDVFLGLLDKGLIK